MILSWGFKKSEGDFFTIRDKVNVTCYDGRDYEGILKGIRPDDEEIIISGLVFKVGEIKDIKHVI